MSQTVGPTNSGNFPATPIFNALIPREGPRMVPFDVDFPTINQLDIDLTLMVQQKRMSVVQSVFIDASQCNASVSLQVVGTDLTIEVQEFTQGFYPLLVPSSPKFICTSASTGAAKLIFMNVPVPASVWNSTASSGTFTGTITDPVVATAPASGDVPLLSSQAGGITALTLATITATGASQSLVAAAAAGGRTFIRIAAPLAEECWVNPTGGAAGVSADGCFMLPAGAIYENPPGMSVFQAWSVFATTAGSKINVWTQAGN
jgi:hypothetical protein